MPHTGHKSWSVRGDRLLAGLVFAVAGYPARWLRLYACVDFIEMTATSFLREAFRADLVGIWHVDLAGTGSYCLADSPAPPEAFHDYAAGHPVIGQIRRAGAFGPVQGRDATGRGILAIPLAIGDAHVRVVAIARSVPPFSEREIILADHLQPVLAGVWAMPAEAAGCSC